MQRWGSCKKNVTPSTFHAQTTKGGTIISRFLERPTSKAPKPANYQEGGASVITRLNPTVVVRMTLTGHIRNFLIPQ